MKNQHWLYYTLTQEKNYRTLIKISLKMAAAILLSILFTATISFIQYESQTFALQFDLQKTSSTLSITPYSVLSEKNAEVVLNEHPELSHKVAEFLQRRKITQSVIGLIETTFYIGLAIALVLFITGIYFLRLDIKKQSSTFTNVLLKASPRKCFKKRK